MGRLFLITLGFHEDHVIRRLVNDKASKNDRVVLITASPIASATQRAYESLTAVCGKMGLPRPELVGVSTDPYEGLKTLINLLGSEESVVLDLSGGMRHLSVYTLIAFLLTRREGKIYLQPESGEVSEVAIPETLIRAFFNPPKPAEVELMRIIGASEGLSVRDLARLSSKSEKTVMNILSSLSRRGLVVRRGRAGGAFLTSAGRLLLEVLR
ncbi:MAG: CRISPR-associated CARF protein Csa3 [Zestosphaera sp.]